MPPAARVGPLGLCTWLTCAGLFCCGLSSSRLYKPLIISFQVLDPTVTSTLQTEGKGGPIGPASGKTGAPLIGYLLLFYLSGAV